MGGPQPWPQVPVGNKDHTSAAVVIIGAGISGTRIGALQLLQPCPNKSNILTFAIGMCMAIDLIKRNQCHNFIIVEKSSGIGGTWK